MTLRRGSPFTSIPTADERPDKRALQVWVLRSLYESIFSGQFGPGSMLTEAELVTRLGVSRQPIREALRQLERDGLVRPAPGNGRRIVRTFGRRNVVEIYAIREALEAVSFRHAAPRVTPAVIRQLEQIQSKLEARSNSIAVLEGKYDSRLDFEFHEVVCRASELPSLLDHLSQVWLQTWALLSQLDLAGTYPSRDEILASYADRRDLIGALRSKDPDAAERAARVHVRCREQQLLEAIDEGRGAFRLSNSARLDKAAAFI